MQMTDYLRLFRQWAEKRNFKDGATIEGQQLKLVEEVGEIAAAIARNNIDGIKDGIGDAAVVLTVISLLRGDAIESILAACYPQKIDIAAALLEDTAFFDDVSDVNILSQVIRYRDVGHYSCTAMVGLVAIAERHELDFVECLAAAWDAIKDRKGRMIGGVFVKENRIDKMTTVLSAVFAIAATILAVLSMECFIGYDRFFIEAMCLFSFSVFIVLAAIGWKVTWNLIRKKN